MENCSYAVVPEETGYPTAIFRTREDALDWAVTRIGRGRFEIRPHDTFEQVRHWSATGALAMEGLPAS